MARSNWLSKCFLLPLSKVYGLVTGVRNLMFDWGILKKHRFNVPVIVVGNIAVGGTGKTPHVEYIIDVMRHSYHIGVLSRGYKRKTKGFVLASQRSSASDIGDEPFQIYQKFGREVTVAVCEDRVAGINEMLRVDPDINLVVLDDAFQHRYVEPTLSIVLTEYNRPVFRDHMLPYGHLRESRRGLHRADIVVVSKCPPNIKALDYRIFEENLGMQAYQRLFFSKFVYAPLQPVFPDQAPQIAPSLEWLTGEDMLLAVAGIGNPRPFVRHIKRFKPKVKVNIFPDHHNFTRKDMDLLVQRFRSMTGRNNFIITTEKDAVRLINCPYFPQQLKPYIYYQPIKVEIMREQADAFVETIRKEIKMRTIMNKH